MSRLAGLSLVLTALVARGADVHGAARVWGGLGFDSNARRDYVSVGNSTIGAPFAFALGQLDGQWAVGSWWRVRGAYDVAGRAFLFVPEESTVVQNAQLDALVTPTTWFRIGLTGRLRDRRGADRDYTDLVGGALLEFAPDAAVEVRASVAAHRFIYWNRFAYSHFGPDTQLSARYRFDRRHSLSVFGQYNPRTYNADATPNPNDPEPGPATTRTDAFIGAGLSYAYRGPFHLSLGYAYFDQTSNSFGETIRRHRLSAMLGLALPWNLTLLASGAVQLSLTPDGVYLSRDLTVLEDDEQSSNVTVKLVKPLFERVDLDVRYALYLNLLPADRFIYLRHVATIGVSVSW